MNATVVIERWLCTGVFRTALDDPALRLARKAIDLVLAGHEPYPAFAIDRHWTLIASNSAFGPLLTGGPAHGKTT